MTDQHPQYPPALSPVETEHITTNIKEWCIAHGLATRPPSAYSDADPHGSLASAAPVTLFPSLFPMNCYHEALMIQTAYNELYINVSRDEAWLGPVVEELAKIDDYIANLWAVHTRVKAEGYAQDLTLGLFRSDYMVHETKTGSSSHLGIKQVEFNTIASSFGGLSSRTCSLHRYLLSTAAYPQEAATVVRPDRLPSNPSIEKLADGLRAAHLAYGPSSEGFLTCVLFITQDKERNVFDQKHLEFSLISNRVKVYRLAFSDVLQRTRLGQGRKLLFSPAAFPARTYEVTTVYYRAGYAPSEYTSKESWETRYHLERSAAIKCPSILTHLAGTKKVQQILATPDSPHLQRLLPFKGMAERVRNTFAPMYPLDLSTPAGEEGRRLALDLKECQRFVMKPQREGGGNNIYREQIPEYLKSVPENEWARFVLMEMIEPPPQRNFVFRDGKVQEGGVICELGVFGTCLWSHSGRLHSRAESLGNETEEEKRGILQNEEAGYLLRTKGDQSQEGGVAAGFGAIDSVCLFDG